MNFQDYLNNSELELTLPQVKAFILGCQLGKKPLDFKTSFAELTNKSNQSSEDFLTEFKNFWVEIDKNKNQELQNIFDKSSDFSNYLENSKEQLDYFLTGLSLAGTTSESTSDDYLKEVLEELEELVLDLEDYLLSDTQSKEETEALKEDLGMLWKELIKKLLIKA